MGPKSNLGVLVRRGFIEVQSEKGKVQSEDRGEKREVQSEDRGKQRSRLCCHSQQTPGIADDSQKLGERRGTISPSEPPEGANPADTLISTSGLPRTARQYISVVSSHQVCGHSLWQP